jgi:hypothetical protein
MKISYRTLWILFALFLGVTSVFAGLRYCYSDAEVIKRATLIIVGNIKEGSIILIPHRVDPFGASSWEHQATLEIFEVLKGQILTNRMTVAIHYGLDPCDASGNCDLPQHHIEFTNQTVKLFDTGHSDTALQLAPFTGDIRTNQIWLLRREQRPQFGDSDCIGIYDPEDIQPTSKKFELMKYLK